MFVDEFGSNVNILMLIVFVKYLVICEDECLVKVDLENMNQSDQVVTYFKTKIK